MVGGIAIVLGIQLLMFGVLSDMIVTVNREQTRRLETIARQLSDQPDEAEDAEAPTAPDGQD
jgi:dolichol-phosphate mannosyltransferase